MDQKIFEWLGNNKRNFPYIAAHYGVSIPTLFKASKAADAKLQQRVIDAIKLAYKERNKK